jgi:hypothetical protein
MTFWIRFMRPIVAITDSTFAVTGGEILQA